ncbi:alpha/beta hydrolase [Pedobacter sp. KR3-3]|uniref:Alpha/beta hydrolase n=1 Tax=Pedobacter albus TaxID=3113905 RepID=A0ABU7ICL9_9SPHI|nr:alpha/beta hydrolase [Pedobacter sp. KR3-3]MEE1947204.1 alpha/beta hydrolase [Pedobacter sp. KR3-3]
MKRSLMMIGMGLIGLMLFTQCEKSDPPSFQVAAEAKTMLNVSYGSDAWQTMDIYLPPNRTTNTGIIILLHGGSFIGGDKNEFTVQAQYLASRGFAVLNVNYRLVDGNGLFSQPLPVHRESAVKIKDQVADVGTVVDYALAHAKEWVVSRNRLALVGHSAGATLGLLYGYDAKNTGKVKAIANLAGALDILFTNLPNWEQLPPYVLEAGYRYTGYEVNVDNEAYYKAISPLYTANASRKIPTLNVFPENNDIDGLPKQDFNTYSAFGAQLNLLKVPNELMFVAGANHTFSQAGKWVLVLDKTCSFLNKNMN